jgi:TonB family protein
VIVLSYNFDNDSIISSIDKSNNYNHSPIKLFSESEMFSFFSDNVKYPKGAFENNFSGIVVIAIKIDTLGNPIDYYVFKSVQESIDAEALRVVRLFASNMKWIAGTKDGQKVESTDSIPIRFTLE